MSWKNVTSSNIDKQKRKKKKQTTTNYIAAKKHYLCEGGEEVGGITHNKRGKIYRQFTLLDCVYPLDGRETTLL